MRKVAGIYKITSPSGKVYIGQSWEINERFGNYRRRECKQQRALLFSFQKHGLENHLFEVVQSVPFDSEQSELDRLEQFWMDHYRALGTQLLNCREAGSKGRLSDETKRRVSEGLRGNIPWNKGTRGRQKHSDETRRKMREAKVGRRPNNYGKARSRYAIERVRIANTGRVRTPEQRARMSAAMKGNTNRKGKRSVRCETSLPLLD